MEEVKIKKKHLAIGVFVAIFIAVLTAFYFYGDGFNFDNTGLAVVATVNGEEITQAQIDEIKEVALENGREIQASDAIEQAITTEILFQEAKENNYLISKEDAEQTLTTQLTNEGFTLKNFKDQIKSEGRSYNSLLEAFQKQLSLQDYLQGELEFPEITSSEVREFYDNNLALLGGEVAPSFEDIEPQIINSLKLQKQQELISNLIDELREKYEIIYT